MGWVGDGSCDDEANNAGCHFDGGDCCGLDASYLRCDACLCYPHETCTANPIELIADGICDDETNNEDCNYDGGDCCGQCVNIDHCTECICLGGPQIDSSCKY